jgi:hypothetical protein
MLWQTGNIIIIITGQNNILDEFGNGPLSSSNVKMLSSKAL